MSVSVEGKLICALIFFIFVSSALNSLLNCSVVLLRIENIEARKDEREKRCFRYRFGNRVNECFLATTYFVAASNVVMFFAKSNKSFLFLSACCVKRKKRTFENKEQQVD